MTDTDNRMETVAEADPSKVELGNVAEAKPDLGDPGKDDRLACWDPENEKFWEKYGNSRQGEMRATARRAFPIQPEPLAGLFY